MNRICRRISEWSWRTAGITAWRHLSIRRFIRSRLRCRTKRPSGIWRSRFFWRCAACSPYIWQRFCWGICRAGGGALKKGRMWKMGLRYGICWAVWSWIWWCPVMCGALRTAGISEWSRLPSGIIRPISLWRRQGFYACCITGSWRKDTDRDWPGGNGFVLPCCFLCVLR